MHWPLFRLRCVFIFLTVIVLVVPLLLPEYTSPALIPGARRFFSDNLVLLFALIGAVALATQFPGAGIAAGLYVAAFVHVARMPPIVLLPSDLIARAGLAAAVVFGTVGVIQRWPSATAGYQLIAGAAVVHLLAMARSGGVAPEPVAAAPQVDVTTSAVDAPLSFPASGGGSRSSSSSSSSSSKDGVATDDFQTRMVTMNVSVKTLPEEVQRRAAFAETLEEHLVQVYAPPNKATTVWNAPAYGPALGMGTRAACGSFKSDISDVCQRMEKASGIYL